MNKLIEKKIASTSMIGKNSNDTIRQITRMMDLVYGSKTFSNIDLSFFDINGSVLLYGIPGVGKTTIVMNCINYALDKYGIEAYTIDTPEVIVSNLGESTQNIYKEFTNPSSEEKEQFILLCIKKCGLEKKQIKKELLEKYITMDDIKNDFRDAILDRKLEKYIKSIVEG